MLAAPANAVYVMPASCAIIYFRNLADSLGRSDLTLVSPRWLARCSQGLHKHVVIDHAAGPEGLERLDQGAYRRAVNHFRESGLLIEA
jgi:hypothetical protein